MAKVWGNEEGEQAPEDQSKRVLGEGGVLTDEDIAALQPEAEKNQEEFKDYQHKKLKKTYVTKEALSRRKNAIHEIEIEVADDEVFVFKAKRMSERDRSRLNKINFGKFGADWENLTQEQIEELSNQAYVVMSEVIVEPKLDVEEWKELADVALLNQLSQMVSKLSTEVNDAVLIEAFKKKSTK